MVARTFLISLLAVVSIGVQLAHGGSSAGAQHNSTSAMNNSEQTVFLEKLRLVRSNQSVRDIESMFGLPAHRKDLVDKKGQFISHELVYVLERSRPGVESERDRVIRFFFDANGNLFKLIFQGIVPNVGETIETVIDDAAGIRLSIVRPPPSN